MNIQLTPVQWFIIVLLWISLGMVLEVIKLLVAVLGNTTSQAPETLKKVSRAGRVKIIEVDPRPIEMAVIKDIAKVFGSIKCSLNYWSNNLLYQVVEREDHPVLDSNIRITTAIQPLEIKEENISYLVPCEKNVISIFDGNPENKYAGQQVIGALIGLLALLAFLYADAAQGAQTFALLFKGNIPSFLNGIIVPLIISSAGSALILGLFIGDILGLTHLGLFRKDTPIYFRWIIAGNLILSLILSTTIALARMELLNPESGGVRGFVNVAQSIVILPMLITTFLLFRGVSGIYVVISLIFSLLAIPFGIFEFFVRISADLLRLGIIGGSFVITRITWLVIGALEIIFWLFELALKAGFAVFTYLLVGIFFIPYFLFRIALRVSKQDQFYDEFLANITKTRLDIYTREPIVYRPKEPLIEPEVVRRSEPLIDEFDEKKDFRE